MDGLRYLDIVTRSRRYRWRLRELDIAELAGWSWMELRTERVGLEGAVWGGQSGMELPAAEL